MAEETITLRLVAQDLMSGNVSKAISGLDKLAKQGGLVGSVLQGVGQSFGQLLNPAGLVKDAIGAVTDVMGDAMKAYREDQVSQAQLQAALEANIEGWNGNADAIENVIAARMRLGFSDDEQRAALSNIVALVGDVNDSLAVERDAMDLARLKSMSLADASLILARAYTGNVTQLQKMGIHVKKGVDGLEALAGVEQRVAGQAEAFSKTSAGAMDAFNVKVGELEEKIGGLLEGPADTFIGWASNIVDVLDGPEGANKSLRDLAAQIYAVKQAASPSSEQLLADMTDQLQRWADTLKLQELNGTPESFAWLDRIGPAALRNFGAASADTLADVRALAQALIDKFGYSEATFQKFRAAVDEIAIPSFNFLTDTWGTSTDQIAEDAAKAGKALSPSNPKGPVAETQRTTRAMVLTLHQAEEPWRQAWADLVAWAKDPFSERKLADFIKRKSNQAAQNAVDAAKNHQAAAARRWQAIADAMKSPVLAAAIEMGASVDDAIASILRSRNLASTLGPLGPGGTGGTIQDSMPNHTQAWWDAHPGAAHRWGHRVTPRRNGGRNNSSTDTTDNRPPDQGPNGSASIVVNVQALVSSEADADRIARALAPALQRHMARAGT